MSITLICAKCGEEDSIVGNDIIPGFANVAAWDMSPDGTMLLPEWGGGTDMDWDNQKPRSDKYPYCCNACYAQYSGAQLVGLIKPPEEE